MHTPRHIAKRHGAAHAKMQGERRWRARTTTGSCTHAHMQTHTRTHTHTYVHTHVHTLTHAHAHERGDDSRRRGVRGGGPRVWVARAARVGAEGGGRDAQLPDCDGSAWRAQLFHVDV